MILEIPGYADACRRVERRRERAWADEELAWEVEGIPLRVIRMRDYARLLATDSWVVGRSNPTPEGIAQVLWLLSPYYAPEGRSLYGFSIPRIIRAWRRSSLIRRLSKMDQETATRLVSSLGEYVNDQLADFAASRSIGRYARPTVGHVTTVVARLSSFFHLAPDTLLEMPVAQATQLYRFACSQSNIELEWFDEAEQIKRDYVRQRNNSQAS